jgi:hypothetical protein
MKEINLTLTLRYPEFQAALMLKEKTEPGRIGQFRYALRAPLHAYL